MRWLLLLLVCLIGPANAQLAQTHAGGAAFVFSGACQTAAGAPAVWYGLRACSAAYATGSNPGITVRRGSDNTTQNINILANGNLDVASANTFAGTDATASCTISTTTATCSGASSTPHVGDTITGAGLTQPCFATAVGTFAGGAGTVTVGGGNNGAAPCGTISVGETLTFQWGLFVTTLWDQSGNGTACFDGASNVTCEATQATNSRQPWFLPNCPLLPCIRGDGTNFELASHEVKTGSALPVSIEVVYERLSNILAFGTAYDWANDAAIFSSSSANNSSLYDGNTASNFAASDNASHVIIGVFNSVASTSIGSVDGVDVSTTLNPGTNPLQNGQDQWVFAHGETQFFNGYWYEAGIWFNGFSSATRTAMCHNAFAYWGTSVSC